MANREKVSLQFVPTSASSYWVTGGIDISAASADDTLGTFYAPFKCLVKQAGIIVTETFAAIHVLHFDKATAGSPPTTASDGDVAIITTVATTHAAGKVIYDDAASVATWGSTANVAAITLDPNQAVYLTLDTDGGATAGQFIPFLIVEEVPETPANISAMIETA